jgi:hypothetical protein
MSEKTKVDYKIDWFKNHPYISYIIVFTIIVISIASFKDSIISLFSKDSEPSKIENGTLKTTIKINLHDSSQIKNIIGRDQTNYYLHDSSQINKTIKNDTIDNK